MSEAATISDVAPAAATPAADPAPAPAAAPVAPAPASVAPAPAPAPAPAAAPAPVVYDLKAPEGVEVDASIIEAFKASAQEAKLAPDAAQAVVAKVAPAIAAQALAQAETFYADIGGMPDKWEAAARADKELGGAEFEQRLAVAKRALDTFGNDSLKRVLDKTGLGSHPEVIRWMHKVGTKISADSFVTGAPSAPAPDAAKVMFPNMN